MDTSTLTTLLALRIDRRLRAQHPAADVLRETRDEAVQTYPALPIPAVEQCVMQALRLAIIPDDVLRP